MPAIDVPERTLDARPSLVRPRGLTIDRLWVVVVLATPVIAAFLATVPAADLAYQVRAGQLMLTGGEILRSDVFTFTVTGEPWLNQQWFAQLLFAGVYRVGGWDLLAAAYAGLMAAAFGLLFLACRRAGAALQIAALLTIAGFWVARQNLSFRPQLLGVALFALTLWILASRNERPRVLFLLPGITLLWANVHGSFVLVPLLVGLSWLEDRRRSPAQARTLLVVGAASVLLTFLNPFGLRVWTYAVGIGTNSTITTSVTEWAPPTIREYSGLVFFLSVAIVVGILARRSTQVGWVDLLWLGSFFALALPALRGVVWWAFVAPIVLARLWSGAPRPERRPGSPILNGAFLVVIVAVAVLVMPWWRPAPPSGGPVWVDQAPQGLASATGSTLEPGSRLFVSQIYASWFEFALPSMPVFVDSRIELFPTSLWRQYLDVGGAREGWQRILDRWDVDAVVISPSQDAELLDHIQADPGWELAYRDDDGSLFVRD